MCTIMSGRTAPDSVIGEIDVRGHAGQFDEPLQRDLAPLAADVGSAQRRHQIASLARQEGLAARQHFHLRFDGREGIDAIAFDVLNLRFRFGERLTDRLHQRFDGAFPCL
jgi:hypothetical protein